MTDPNYPLRSYAANGGTYNNFYNTTNPVYDGVFLPLRHIKMVEITDSISETFLLADFADPWNLTYNSSGSFACFPSSIDYRCLHPAGNNRYSPTILWADGRVDAYWREWQTSGTLAGYLPDRYYTRANGD
ncbi:MAG: hypothetical protein HY350_02440 [Candidatus Omnitrophica bacterium]|nr:hypothetical protein [Candidatus Omnitrophota bacterium]